MTAGISTQRNWLAAAAALAFACTQASAQILQPLDLPTTNGSVKITTGSTYQQLLAALAYTTDSQRKSLTIQNNNTNGDNCWLIIGAVPNTSGAAQIVAAVTTASTIITVDGTAMTAQQASILLQQGVPFTRYLPNIPSDVLFVTCATTGDSVYVDTQ